MDFSLSEEQRLISDTAEAFLKECSDSTAVRRAMDSECGWEPALWRRICTEMGWQGIHFPESVGGLGLDYTDLVIVMEQVGRHLLCAPLLSSICMAANALLRVADEAGRQRWLPALLSGEQTAALAWRPLGSRRPDAAATAVVAESHRGGYRLSGALGHVIDGHSAELLVVAARAADSVGGDGVSLFIFPAATEGVSRRVLPTMDQGRRQAEVQLKGVQLPAESLLGSLGSAATELDSALDLARVALAAEQAGAARHCLEMTVEYTGQREQFGRAIAGFQAVKHKCADMMVAVESMRSAAWYGGCVAGEFLRGSLARDELAEAASLAAARCGDGLFHCAAESLQLHGGVGFTWEYDVHLYFKRALSAGQLLGAPAWHRQRLARRVLDGEEI